MRFLLFFAVALLSLSGCVTNKKFIYFQREDVNRKGLVKDTVIRVYPQVSFEYKVQPNDALFVDFKSLTEAEFNFLKNNDQAGVGGGTQAFVISSELVDPEGSISFPVIGKVQVAGLTIFEIKEKLQTFSNQYFQSATVNVRLVNFRFTIMGEVNAEGTITTFNNRVSLPEAIGLAGGITDLADKANVKIIRQFNGQTQVAYVDLLDESFLASPYYFINQSDVIVVPGLKQRPYRKYLGQNLSVFIASLSLLLTVINLSN